MKKHIQIMVEGEADKRFLEDFISVHFPEHPHELIITPIGGIGNLFKATIRQKLTLNREIHPDSYCNLAFVDADDTDKDHGIPSGYQLRRKYLEEKFSKKELGDIYIFPDNKSHEGTLETFLAQLIAPSLRASFDCIETYRACLASVRNANPEIEFYNFPDDKQRFFIYCHLHSADVKPKDTTRSYLNSSLWTLNDTENEYVKALRAFLTPHFLA